MKIAFSLVSENSLLSTNSSCNSSKRNYIMSFPWWQQLELNKMSKTCTLLLLCRIRLHTAWLHLAWRYFLLHLFQHRTSVRRDSNPLEPEFESRFLSNSLPLPQQPYKHRLMPESDRKVHFVTKILFLFYSVPPLYLPYNTDGREEVRESRRRKGMLGILADSIRLTKTRSIPMPLTIY